MYYCLHPLATPTPTCKGKSIGDSWLVAYELTSLEVKRLRHCPTTMGLTPPSFLSNAINLPPKKKGLISSGILPSTRKLTSEVIAVSKEPELPSITIRSFRCCGVKPSDPPEEPGGKEKIALRTHASSKDNIFRSGLVAGDWRLSGGTGGCLSCSAFTVSIEGVAKNSSKQTLLKQTNCTFKVPFL